MGAEDALKTMECIPKPSAGSGQRHFLGAPLTPDAFARSLANCLVRVIRALPQQQQNRIWRRFRNYEIYLA